MVSGGMSMWIPKAEPTTGGDGNVANGNATSGRAWCVSQNDQGARTKAGAGRNTVHDHDGAPKAV